MRNGPHRDKGRSAKLCLSSILPPAGTPDPGPTTTQPRRLPLSYHQIKETETS